MECNYHKIFDVLHVLLWARIEEHYDWEFFGYWLGDESNLGRRYIEVFQNILNVTLTEEQQTLLRKKGENLENQIHKWRAKWRQNHPELPNDNMSKNCLQFKLYEYLNYQLSKPDMIRIIGRPCV
jgi:hypothetical protein